MVYYIYTEYLQNIYWISIQYTLDIYTIAQFSIQAALDVRKPPLSSRSGDRVRKISDEVFFCCQCCHHRYVISCAGGNIARNSACLEPAVWCWRKVDILNSAVKHGRHVVVCWPGLGWAGLGWAGGASRSLLNPE